MVERLDRICSLNGWEIYRYLLWRDRLWWSTRWCGYWRWCWYGWSRCLHRIRRHYIRGRIVGGMWRRVVHWMAHIRVYVIRVDERRGNRAILRTLHMWMRIRHRVAMVCWHWRIPGSRWTGCVDMSRWTRYRRRVPVALDVFIFRLASTRKARTSGQEWRVVWIF